MKTYSLHGLVEWIGSVPLQVCQRDCELAVDVCVRSSGRDRLGEQFRGGKFIVVFVGSAEVDARADDPIPGLAAFDNLRKVHRANHPHCVNHRMGERGPPSLGKRGATGEASA